MAFKELIQYDYTVQAVTKEMRRLVEDSAYRSKMLEDYSEIRSRLGGTGASRAVAKAMIKELRSTNSRG
jgi:lipid A disaccharide synthetase